MTRPVPPERASRSLRRRVVLTGLAIGAFAAALRVTFVVAVSGHAIVRYEMLDSQSYHLKALRIAGGDWLGDAVFFQAPLYPYFLAGLYALFGAGSLGVLVAQALLDAGTVGLVYLLALRIFDWPRAVLAGVLAIFYPLFFYYDALLLKPALSVFLITATLALLVTGARRDRRGLWLAAGLSLGVAILTRGNYLLFAPVLLVWIATASGGDARARLVRMGLVVAGTSLVILPVTARNYAVGGELVLVTSQAGVNFYIGNFRGNDSGRYQSLPFVTANPLHEERLFREEAMRRTGGASFTKGELSRFWTREALREIAADPAHFVRHSLRKLTGLLNDYEVPASQSYYFFRAEAAPVLGLLPGWGTLLPLALLGVLAARGRRLAQIPVLFALSYSATVVVTYNMSRYRMPIVPVALVFAGAGAWSVWSLARERRLAALAGCAVFLVLGWLATHREVPRHSFAGSHYNLGGRHFNEASVERSRAQRLARRGEHAAAEEARRRAQDEVRLSETQFRRGLELEPGHEQLRIALARLQSSRARDLEAAGQPEQALAPALEATQTAPRSARAHVTLGRVYAALGRYPQARRSLRLAVALDPDLREAREELAFVDALEIDVLEREVKDERPATN